MTTYYVDSIDGSDSNDGSTPALAFATLNAAEDVPVAANDTVIVRGGTTYRETLVIDVSGSSGSPITYEADVHGLYWSGSGGPARITGSDNDQTETRSYTIQTTTTRAYRTFKHFVSDGGYPYVTDSNNFIFEDCVFKNSRYGLYYRQSTDLIMRRCVFYATREYGLRFWSTTALGSANNYVENTLFHAGGNSSGLVTTDQVGSCTFRNCTITGNYSTFTSAPNAQPSGEHLYLYNSLISTAATAMYASTAGDVVEDYNCISNYGSRSTNVTPGSNSLDYITLHAPPYLLNGYVVKDDYAGMASYAELNVTDDGSAPNHDLFGMPRPSTNGRRTLGAIQMPGWEKDETTVHGGDYSIKWPTGCGYYVMTVPVSPSTSTTISAYVRRATGYTGTNPKMIIREPGQSDRVTTDTGSADAWNQITDTWTTQSTTTAVQVIFQVDNTSSTDYAAYLDDVAVS